MANHMQPTVIVYPRCKAIQADDENLTIGNRMPLTICNLKIQQLPIWSLIALAPPQVQPELLYTYTLIYILYFCRS